MSAIGPLTLAMTMTPAAAIILILLIRGPRAAEAINLIASTVSLLSIVLILVLAPSAKSLFWGKYVIIDGLGAWTTLVQPSFIFSAPSIQSATCVFSGNRIVFRTFTRCTQDSA